MRRKSGSSIQPDFTTYLSRDTHQVKRSNGTILKHSNKRFGTYNEVPPGNYFLIPAISTQKYKLYVVDSQEKSAGAANGIEGPDGPRGGIALYRYTPRFSVGCFTFNSKTSAPVEKLKEELPDLFDDAKPVYFIVEPREVMESEWENKMYGTKKWTGI